MGSLHSFRSALALTACALALTACDTFAEPEEVPGALRIIETDKRAPARAAEPPPPIQGGSLLALSDGMHAVVGDPDRHRLLVVELDPGRVVSEIELPRKALPQRLVEDGAGRVHAVVRGTHELLTLDPQSGEVLEEKTVCSEPRGLAYQATRDALLLACAGGTLWTFSAETGETLDKQFVAPDLRDVVATSDGGAWLTTFRSAELYRMLDDGSVSLWAPLPDAMQQVLEENGQRLRELKARGAWRAVDDGSDGVVVVHQRATTDTIEIEPHEEGDDAQEPDEDGVLRQPTGSVSVGSYGGGLQVQGVGGQDPGAGCGAIVSSAVSSVGTQGAMRTTAPLSQAVLPVDVAVSQGDPAAPQFRKMAVVSAGLRDPEAPRAKVVFPEVGSRGAPPRATPLLGLADGGCVGPGCGLSSGSVQILPLNAMREDGGGGCLQGATVGIQEPAISVAFTASQLLVQTREPSKLYVVDPAQGNIINEITLGGESVADTGHDLFHRDAGDGIACASCHLEGSDDGHTWHFTGLGARRTQPLNVNLRGTQPFHWDGTLPDLGPLMSTVFVGRMGGAPQDGPRLETLSDWVLDLEPPKPVRDEDDAAAQSGKALFHSAEVGCVSCHNGPKLTNNQSADVGTSDGVPLQVPSLLGVARRLPLMHDGCAGTLVERFDPGCGGGDMHGKTSHLSAAEIDDLVAYLETL